MLENKKKSIDDFWTRDTSVHDFFFSLHLSSFHFDKKKKKPGMSSLKKSVKINSPLPKDLAGIPTTLQSPSLSINYSE